MFKVLSCHSSASNCTLKFLIPQADHCTMVHRNCNLCYIYHISATINSFNGFLTYHRLPFTYSFLFDGLFLLLCLCIVYCLSSLSALLPLCFFSLSAGLFAASAISLFALLLFRCSFFATSFAINDNISNNLPLWH